MDARDQPPSLLDELKQRQSNLRKRNIPPTPPQRTASKSSLMTELSQQRLFKRKASEHIPPPVLSTEPSSHSDYPLNLPPHPEYPPNHDKPPFPDPSLLASLLPPPPIITQDFYDIPPPTDLPPVYMPPPNDLPPLLTCAATLDENGQKLLLQLGYKYKEFFEVGERVSEQAKMLPQTLFDLFSHLELSINKLPDKGDSFTFFISKIIAYAKNLSELKEPFPYKMNNLSQMTLLDIRHTFSELQKCIIDPTANEIFKRRAIHCVSLTFAYGKLQQSRNLLSNYDPEQVRLIFSSLIAPLQRLAQIGLFAKDALDIFKSLNECNKINSFDHEFISDIIIILNDLINRSKLVALAADKIQNVITLVAMDTLEKRFSEAALKQLIFFEELVHKHIPLIMESNHPEDVLEMIDKELNTHFTLKSAELYRDVSNLIDSAKSDPSVIIPLKENLKKDLSVIHENLTMDDQSKLTMMKIIIKDAYNNKIVPELNNLSRKISYWWSPPTSDLEKNLKPFIQNEMKNYETVEPNDQSPQFNASLS